jgi:hypothetical protein
VSQLLGIQGVCIGDEDTRRELGRARGDVDRLADSLGGETKKRYALL